MCNFYLVSRNLSVYHLQQAHACQSTAKIFGNLRKRNKELTRETFWTIYRNDTTNDVIKSNSERCVS